MPPVEKSSEGIGPNKGNSGKDYPDLDILIDVYLQSIKGENDYLGQQSHSVAYQNIGP